MREGSSGHTPAPAGRPLSGVLVLDFSQFLAGPSCALRLGDLGAEVVKVERPQGGDLCRSLYLAGQAFAGDSALFHTINRGKKSFAADLKEPRGLARVKALIARADVMIHNFRPGVMERIGLGFDAVSALNPRLIYATVSGYGVTGPWRGKPGQDLLVQAMSGLAWLSGDAAQGPVPIGISLADMAAGAHLCQGILALLVRRAVNGHGGRVEASLLESALDLQFEQFTAFLNTSEREQPRRSAVNNANVGLGAPYGIYKTSDSHIAVSMTPVDHLGALIDCAELAACHDKDAWFRDRDAIKTVLAVHLATRPTAHWLSILEPADVWCAPVFTWPELEQHEGFAALRMTQRIGDGAAMQTTRCPIRLDGEVLGSTQAGPALGQHTDEIVRTFGLDRTG